MLADMFWGLKTPLSLWNSLYFVVTKTILFSYFDVWFAVLKSNYLPFILYLLIFFPVNGLVIFSFFDKKKRKSKHSWLIMSVSTKHIHYYFFYHYHNHNYICPYYCYISSTTTTTTTTTISKALRWISLLPIDACHWYVDHKWNSENYCNLYFHNTDSASYQQGFW